MNGVWGSGWADARRCVVILYSVRYKTSYLEMQMGIASADDESLVEQNISGVFW